nr:ABC transporter substrate-binding protein [Micromonospora sp. DSM 115978]
RRTAVVALVSVVVLALGFAAVIGIVVGFAGDERAPYTAGSYSALERTWTDGGLRTCSDGDGGATTDDTDGASVDTFGSYVLAQGGTTAAIVRSDLAPPLSTDIGQKLEASLREVGVQVIEQEFRYNHNLPDAGRLGQQIRDSGADVVVG